MNARPHCLRELGNWKPIPAMAALKAEVLDILSKVFILQRLAGNSGFPLIVRCYARCGVYGENMFQSFLSILMWYFLSRPMYRNRSTSFWISLTVNYSMYISTSIGGRKVKSLPYCHLGDVTWE